MPKKSKDYEELLSIIKFYHKTNRGNDMIVAANQWLSLMKNEKD